ncbi:MAG: alpha/beta fold hydrolase [Candidatus Sulfopaludibacter sp.]|nr:alpha/beta fold hydrolase [Candidatus Sulfopaludibacter sp.]
MKKHSRIFIIAGLLALCGIAGSLVVANGALHIYIRPLPDDAVAQAVADAARAGWQAAEVTASDGVVLRGWLFTPYAANGAAVILLHGVGDTRKGVLNHAKYLLQAGFAVLAPDSRGHGASQGDYITYGVKEAGDVHAWGNWLFANRPVQRLYGMGESMGAAVILQSLATEPRLRAVVAECPFATFREVAYDRLSTPAFPPHFSLWPIIQIGYIYARMRYGVDLRLASPLPAVRATHVPVLLIHGTADTNIPCRNSEELHAANPAFTTLWLVPGATHVNALARDPERYIQRVTGWFRDRR